YTDRGTCILLADAAGAAVLRATDGPSGILDTDLYSDGRYGDLLIQPGGGSRNPATHQTVEQRLHYCKMKGNEVFKVAVRMFGDCAERILARHGFTAADGDLFVPHQANLRIIEAAVKRLKLPMERVIVNVDRYGNTGAASVYVALEEAWATKRLNAGDLVLLAAFGGGLTWGAALLRWRVWPICSRGRGPRAWAWGATWPAGRGRRRCGRRPTRSWGSLSRGCASRGRKPSSASPPTPSPPSSRPAWRRRRPWPSGRSTPRWRPGTAWASTRPWW